MRHAYAIALVLLIGWVPAEGQTLHSVKKTTPLLRRELRLLGWDPYKKDFEDVTARGRTQPLYEICFSEDETFLFILPQSLLDLRTSPNLFADGMKVFLHDADGDPKTRSVPYLIPNRLRRIRQALLGAERHFAGKASEAKMPWNLYKPDEPIRIYVGVFAPKKSSTRAYACYNTQRIKVRHNLPASRLEKTPVHEYFHLVQKMVCNTDNDVYDDFLAKRDDYYWNFIDDMTCEWATDEPIGLLRVTAESPSSVDSVNLYASGLSQLRTEKTFFSRSRYASGVIVKYLAEQLAGGKDTSRAADVFELHRRIYRSGTANRQTVLKAIGETLPKERYRGSRLRDRWLHFYCDFAASCIVQRASPGNSPADRLGFHDDAFRDRLRYFKYHRTTDPQSARPPRAYQKPAADDAERRKRLKEITGSPDRVSLLASKFHLIDLSDQHGARPSGIEPRPLFLYAEAPAASSDVFALQQLAPSGKHDKRAGSRFLQQAGFSLWDDKAGDYRDFVVAEVPGMSHESHADYVWVGLVNGLSRKDYQPFTWAYIASPRLVPSAGAPMWGSRTVRPWHGTPGRRSNAGLNNGDPFVLEVVTTSPVHVGDNPQRNIPADRRSVHMEIVSRATGRPVMLVEKDGVRLRVTTQAIGRGQRYLFHGQIAPDNGVTGPCTARVRLTSLLNMGGGDRQVDDSCSFHVRDARPRVKRVLVTQGRRTIYDSRTMRRAPARLEDGKYEMTVQVWFSEPMSRRMTFLLAGLSPPYRQFNSSALTWTPDKRSCTGRFVISKVAIPRGGDLVHLAIEGQASGGTDLDADAHTPGDQPDTEHFVLVDMEGFYDLKISAEARFMWANAGADVYKGAKFRPIEVSLRLIPRASLADVAAGGGEDASDLTQEYLATLRGQERLLTGKERILADWKASSRGSLDPQEANRQAAEMVQELTELRANTKALREFRDEVACLARVMGGLCHYGFDERRSGPIAARFRGADWTDSRSSSGRSETRTTEWKLHAKPWKIDDVRKSKWWQEGDQWPPTSMLLVVWRYDPGDIRVLRRLMAELPDPGESAFAKTFYNGLFGTALEMWQSGRPAGARRELAGMDTVRLAEMARQRKPGKLQFPPLGGSPLVRLDMTLGLLDRFPISCTGTYERTVKKGIVVVDRKHAKIKVPETREAGSFIVRVPPPVGPASISLRRARIPERPKVWYPTRCYPLSDLEWDGSSVHVYAAGSEDWVRGGFTCREVGPMPFPWTKHETWRWEARYNDKPLPPIEEVTSRPASDSGGQDKRPGVLTGSVVNASGMDTGHVVVYLEGAGLPRGAPQTASFTLKGPFRPRFIALPVGSRLRFTNDDDRRHEVYSRSSACPFRLAMEQGARQEVPLTRAGKIRVRDRRDDRDQVKVLVVPGGCFADAGGGGYRIAGIPPGTYLLKAVTESGRFGLSVQEVTIEAGKATVRDIRIQPRP